MNTNKKFILLCGMALLAMLPVQAQKVTKDYQRPSLHMVLLTTDEPSAPEEFMEHVSASWQTYMLPAMFNEFEIPFKEAKAGNPKGSMMQLITEYGSRLGSLS
ncbi:MAG: hypothetical protein K2I83_05335, partial [Bacteroidales bacterium]|nr:hypothetical protein [Bacteroidales bacterium]